MTSVKSEQRFETWTSRLVRRIRRRYNDHCITILTYHSISPEPSVFTDGTGLRHDPHDFEREITYLSENYNVMRLRDIVSALERGERLRRAVAITFDDGYADNLRLAWPMLFRRRLPMTIFPVTSVVGNHELMWQHKLAWLIANGHTARVRDALRARGLQIDDAATDDVVSDFVRQNYTWDIPHVLESVMNAVGAQSRKIAQQYELYLEPEEIAEADPEFVDFGNHTDTHPILSALRVSEQMAEISTAQRKLVEWTGHPPVALAYPFGLKRHYEEETRHLVQSTGHRAALDMRRRLNFGDRSPFDLSRKPANCESQFEFEMMIEDWPVNAGESVGGPA